MNRALQAKALKLQRQIQALPKPLPFERCGIEGFDGVTIGTVRKVETKVRKVRLVTGGNFNYTPRDGAKFVNANGFQELIPAAKARELGLRIAKRRI
jgi:hypothetical protein